MLQSHNVPRAVFSNPQPFFTRVFVRRKVSNKAVNTRVVCVRATHMCVCVCCSAARVRILLLCRFRCALHLPTVQLAPTVRTRTREGARSGGARGESSTGDLDTA